MLSANRIASIAAALLGAVALRVVAGDPRTFVVENAEAKLTVTEIVLTTLKDGAWTPGRGGTRLYGNYPATTSMILVSPNARRTMYWRATGGTSSGTAGAGGRQRQAKGRVVVDGRESPVYIASDGRVNESWCGGFSPDSKHYAYIAYPDVAPRPRARDRSVPEDARPCRLIVDGRAGSTYWLLKGCDSLQARGPGRNLLAPVWSRDSRRVACRAVSGSSTAPWTVVVNGRAHKQHFEVGTPVFSPDGRKVAYPAAEISTDVRRGSADIKWYVMVDRTKLAGSWEGIRPPVFSPNSRRIAYVAAGAARSRRDGGRGRGAAAALLQRRREMFGDSPYRLLGGGRGELRERVIVDRKQGPEFDEIVCEPRFSPDSRQLAYIARNGEQYHMVVNGRKGTAYLCISRTNLAFSPDGRRLAYAAGSGEWVGADFDMTRWHFDSTMTAAGVGRDRFRMPNRWRMVVDQKEIETDYSGVVTYSVGFSPDSKRLGYAASRGGKQFIVVDGQEGPAEAGTRVHHAADRRLLRH